MCGEGRHIRAAEKRPTQHAATNYWVQYADGLIGPEKPLTRQEAKWHADNSHILWEDLLAEIYGSAPKKMTGTEIAWSILRWTGLIIAAWFFVLAILIVLST